MPYIGNDIQYGELNSQTFTGDGSTTAFTLNYTVSNVNSLLVTVADVIQEPTTAYTVSGTTLTFTSAPANSDTIHVRYLGRTLDVGTTAIVQDSDQDTKIQVEESADEDTIRFDTGGTEIATATNTYFNINNLNNTAANGIIESNANFVDTCLVGPSVDGKAWAGKFENGSVWSSLMLATVETSGSDAEVNIWDLTAGTLASATPLATVTLTGATPTSIAASMGYVIVGTSDQGMHIVDPHGGSWAERTVGWPYSLSSTTTPNLTDDYILSVCAGLSDASPNDPRTGGPLPEFGLVYGAGVDSASIIKSDGNVYDAVIPSGAIGAEGCAIANGVFFFAADEVGKNVLNRSPLISTIVADDWTVARRMRNDNYPFGFGVENAVDIQGSSVVAAAAEGLTLEVLGSIPAEDMLASINTTYTTGYYVGDIKLIALANSKTADRSYNANTLTENGTVTETAVETGAELLGYSGFASGVNLTRGDDADYNSLGTGAVHQCGWLKCSGNSAVETLTGLANAGNTIRFTTRLAASGTISFTIAGASTSGGINSTSVLDDGEWHRFDIVRRSNTELELWVDGVLEATDATAYGSISGTILFAIGVRPDDGSTEPATTTTLSLVRLAASAPSGAQILKAYEAEKKMFAANAKCLLQGASNAVLDARIDPITGKYIVTQSDTQDIFDGLTIDTERTIAAGGTTFEHGLLWGDAVAEINDANLFASTPATDQRQVNEMVRSMAAELPAGVDLSKAKAWVRFDHFNEVIEASYNVESCTNVGAGSFYVTWAIPFKFGNSNDSGVVVVVSADRGDAMIDFGAAGTPDMTEKVYVLVKNTGTNTPGDAVTFVVAFGELENE